MHHTFHKHRQEGNQPQRQGVQGQENGHGQNGTHHIFLHTVILSLTLNPRVGWSFSTGCLSQPVNVNVRKRRKKTLTNANYAKKPSALATCQESNFFKSGGHPKLKFFSRYTKMNFWQFRQHVLQVLSSIQKPYVHGCMNIGHAVVAISLHGGRERKEKKHGSTCSKALWSAALRS